MRYYLDKYLLPGQTIGFNRIVNTQVFGIVIWAQSFEQTSRFGMLPPRLPGAFRSICGLTKRAISSSGKHSRRQTATCVNWKDKMTLERWYWFDGEHPSADRRQFPAHSCRGGSRQPGLSHGEDVLLGFHTFNDCKVVLLKIIKRCGRCRDDKHEDSDICTMVSLVKAILQKYYSVRQNRLDKLNIMVFAFWNLFLALQE